MSVILSFNIKIRMHVLTQREREPDDCNSYFAFD